MVEATPISGPALMWTPQCVSNEIDEPTTLTIPTVKAPRSRQYLNAIRESAVSPDWETNTQVSSRNTGACLSRKSDANSTAMGISVNSSNTPRTAMQEWYLVPQAMKMTRLQRRIVVIYCLRPPRVTFLFGTSKRPRIVLMTDSGCSNISFCMKWSNVPFMISCNSSSIVWIARTLEVPSSFIKRWMFSCPSWIWAISSSSRYRTFFVCSSMADGSEDTKNSAG